MVSCVRRRHVAAATAYLLIFSMKVEGDAGLGAATPCGHVARPDDVVVSGAVMDGVPPDPGLLGGKPKEGRGVNDGSPPRPRPRPAILLFWSDSEK